MHGNLNDARQDSKDLIMCFEALLKLNVLVPERMGEEVQSDTASASLKQSCDLSVKLSSNAKDRTGGRGRGEGEGKEEEEEDRGEQTMFGTS